MINGSILKITKDFKQLSKLDDSKTAPEVALRKAFSIIGFNKEEAPIFQLGLSVANSEDLVSKNAYHNHMHAAEATISAAHLLVAEYKDKPDLLKKYGPNLLVTMLAHDIGHTGKVNVVHAEEEWASFHRLEKIVDNFKIKQEEKGINLPDSFYEKFIDISKEIIIGTEFQKETKKNVQSYNEEKNNHSGFDLPHLKLLANEADILMSCNPLIGPERGRQLGVEQKNNIGSWKSRAFFLENLVKYVSNGSKLLGIPEAIQDQIDVIKKLDPVILDKMIIEKGDKFVDQLVLTELEKKPKHITVNDPKLSLSKLDDLKVNPSFISSSIAANRKIQQEIHEIHVNENHELDVEYDSLIDGRKNNQRL